MSKRKPEKDGSPAPKKFGFCHAEEEEGEGEDTFEEEERELNYSPDMFSDHSPSPQVLPLKSPSLCASAGTAPLVSLSPGTKDSHPPLSGSPVPLPLTNASYDSQSSSMQQVILEKSPTKPPSISYEFDEEVSFDWSEDNSWVKLNRNLSLEHDFEAISADTRPDLQQALATLKDDVGIHATARAVLEDADIKQEILNIICATAHQEFKESLKDSQISKDKIKTERNYLLSVTPSSLCHEFFQNAPVAFQLLVRGLIGVNDLDCIEDNYHLKNNIAIVYSTVAKLINRKATGYAMVQTAAARDGGLREDSLKLFSNFCAPRTMQRYDAEVLAKDWDSELNSWLKEEAGHYKELANAEAKLAAMEEAGVEDVSEAQVEVTQLRDNLPPQVQCVWDNINLRSKHRYDLCIEIKIAALCDRFARERDVYSESNLDWMASLFHKERISVNYMEHMEHKPGCSIKEVSDLSISDFIPSGKEKDYLFIGLVHYYSSRLVERHPNVFKSINSSVTINHSHQFEAAMSMKSDEFTGPLFTMSESKTEDLIKMMSEVQEKFVHKFLNSSGEVDCYEKKILSGDQKTEKNSFYAILRYVVN
jgi:hypothetical protein